VLPVRLEGAERVRPVLSAEELNASDGDVMGVAGELAADSEMPEESVGPVGDATLNDDNETPVEGNEELGSLADTLVAGVATEALGALALKSPVDTLVAGTVKETEVTLGLKELAGSVREPNWTEVPLINAVEVGVMLCAPALRLVMCLRDY